MSAYIQPIAAPPARDEGSTYLVRHDSKDFRALTRPQKRDAVRQERQSKPRAQYICMASKDVQALIRQIRNKMPAIKESTTVINDNWSEGGVSGLDVMVNTWNVTFSVMRVYTPKDWDAEAVAAMAVLSEIAPGQGDAMGEALKAHMQHRRAMNLAKSSEKTLTTADIYSLINNILKDSDPDFKEIKESGTKKKRNQQTMREQALRALRAKQKGKDIDSAAETLKNMEVGPDINEAIADMGKMGVKGGEDEDEDMEDEDMDM